MIKKLATSLVLSACACVATAATPTRLGYQGNLADSGGSPITSNGLSITFRLYDVASGGSALWTEVQPVVAVDGGNFSVELGSVTPLPKAIFGRQLYLGMQIAGDSEMAPRPALTAAPFALRAGQTLANTLQVSADGSATENGTALLAALATAVTATAASPLTIELDAGSFDVAATSAVVPSYVTVIGRGQAATQITGTQSDGAVLRLSSYAEVRELSARNTAPSAGSAVAIGAFGAAGVNEVVDGVRLSHVTGESVAASDPAGNGRQGLYACMRGSRMEEVTGIGEGGAFAFGLRADCNDGNGFFIDGATLMASGAATGLRGAYLKGGGPWQRIKVFIDTHTGLQDVYGLRVFKSPIDTGAALEQFFISVEGTSSPSSNVNSAYYGLVIEGADLFVANGAIGIENAQAKNLVGLRYIAIPGEKEAAISSVRIDVEGTQQGALGPGQVVGARFDYAGGRMVGSEIQVECIDTTYNGCIGVRRLQQNGAQPMQGPLLLNQVTVDVSTPNPTDIGNLSVAVQISNGEARIRNSSLNVQRSAEAELAVGLELAANASAVLMGSTVSVDSVASPNANTAVNVAAASPAFEALGNVLQGAIVVSGNPNAVCSGNTRRGTGFSASGCP